MVGPQGANTDLLPIRNRDVAIKVVQKSRARISRLLLVRGGQCDTTLQSNQITATTTTIPSRPHPHLLEESLRRQRKSQERDIWSRLPLATMSRRLINFFFFQKILRCPPSSLPPTRLPRERSGRMGHDAYKRRNYVQLELYDVHGDR